LDDGRYRRVSVEPRASDTGLIIAAAADVSRGNRRRKHVIFTTHAAADALLNDLDGHPHAFLVACVME
jgi:hypothetical protein